MPSQPPEWYKLRNVHTVDSPALLIYPERVAENIRRMIAMAGGPERLRPHVKTHKMAEVVKMQMAAGISRFKCATIAEAEMLAGAGAPDVLLAYQPVGPKIQRFVALLEHFPGTLFSAIVDDEATANHLAAACRGRLAGNPPRVYLDIDCGMHRTGVAPGGEAIRLYGRISKLPGLQLAGLHAYDGHIHESGSAERTAHCDTDFAPVLDLARQLRAAGFDDPVIIAGGSPTFPRHARRSMVQCSPGTCLLWDAGYGKRFPDLDFLPAALVLTRIVSKPASGRLCFDLGHKAIASENPHPRVKLLGLEEAVPVVHSEEHLVVETPKAAEAAVGDAYYGIPHHVCPTVALYGEAVVVEEGQAQGKWKIAARERALTI